MHTQDQSDVKALLPEEMNTANQPAVVGNQLISVSSSVRPVVTTTASQILPQKRTFNSSSSKPISQIHSKASKTSLIQNLKFSKL